MFSSKVILVVLVVVACSANLALSTSIVTPITSDEDTDLCKACKNWVTNAKVDLPTTIEQLKTYKSLCKTLASEKHTKKCEKIIEDVIENIAIETAEQICTRVMLCNKTNQLVLTTKVNVICEACKKWVTKAKSDLPVAVKQLESLKSFFCKNLGVDEKVRKCELSIDEAIKKLEMETPEQICTRMMLCGNK